MNKMICQVRNDDLQQCKVKFIFAEIPFDATICMKNHPWILVYSTFFLCVYFSGNRARVAGHTNQSQKVSEIFFVTG